MFLLPYFRPALRCSKRLKLSTPIRPLTTTTSSADTNTNTSTQPNPEESISAEFKDVDASNLSAREAAYAENPDSNLEAKEWMERLESIESKFRLPRSVQAVYFQPLKRQAEYGLPVCDLQLRSYSAMHVTFFCDFALRAAYYLNLPASGPVPLPRIIERWTVSRSPFIHRKKPENFERITRRRLIQIKDGNPDVVQAWLAFLRKHAFHGVGMKANVWEFSDLDVGKSMDETGKSVLQALEKELGHFGTRKGVELEESLLDVVGREKFTRSHAPLQEVRKG